jgi:hypothetical protein
MSFPLLLTQNMMTKESRSTFRLRESADLAGKHFETVTSTLVPQEPVPIFKPPLVLSSSLT